MHIIPQLRDLQQKFGNGLVIIGVHSPKFSTEQADSHVREAVKRYHIDHPVVNDARLSLWRTLGVEAWPTVLLLDPDGYVVGVAMGEGIEPALEPLMKRVAAAYRAVGRLDTKPLKMALERTGEKILSFPGKITIDGTGQRLFIADSGHHRILICSRSGAVLETIGTGKAGRADGSYRQASFNNPQGLALVGSRLYVADTDNHMIRAVDLASHVVSTIAGTGRQMGEQSYPRAPRQQDLSSPWDVNYLDGYLYIAMAGDHRIWRYDPLRNRIEVFAGSGREARTDGVGTEAAFAQPSGLTNDGRYLYVADSESSTIRRIDPRSGVVISLNEGDLFDFGKTDGAASGARFQHPLGISYANGRLYITDTYNNDIRVLDLTRGAVTTLAGTDHAGFQDGRTASFFEPGGAAVYRGLLYVADTDNGLIRTVDVLSGATSTVPITASAPTATEPAANGRIEGRLVIGPISPVERPGQVNTRGFAGDVEIEGANGFFAQIHSAPDGSFSLAVPPGQYTVTGKTPVGKPYPRGGTTKVTVAAGETARAVIEFDSGIR